MGILVEIIVERDYHITKASFGECEIGKIAYFTSLTKHSAKLL